MMGSFMRYASILPGEKHMLVRKLMGSAFTKKGVNSYLHEIARLAEDYCSEWAHKGSIVFVDEVKLFLLYDLAQSAASALTVSHEQQCHWNLIPSRSACGINFCPILPISRTIPQRAVPVQELYRPQCHSEKWGRTMPCTFATRRIAAWGSGQKPLNNSFTCMHCRKT